LDFACIITKTYNYENPSNLRQQ